MDSSSRSDLVGSIVSLQAWTKWPADYGIIIRIDDFDPELCDVLLPEHGVWTFLIEDLDIVVQPNTLPNIIESSGGDMSWYETIKKTIEDMELV